MSVVGGKGIDETIALVDRRMKHIYTIQENCPKLCWTDICMWAQFRNIGTVALDGAKKCRQESSEYGSCYCGRFQGGLDCDRLVEVTK